MTKPPKYWMVHSHSFGPPTYRHTTRVSAENEAKRLAREHQGRHFFILEATDVVMKEDVIVMSLNGPA